MGGQAIAGEPPSSFCRRPKNSESRCPAGGFLAGWLSAFLRLCTTGVADCRVDNGPRLCFRAATLVLAVSLPVSWLTLNTSAAAQVDGRFPDVLPKATIVSDESDAARGSAPLAEEDLPPPTTAVPAIHSRPNSRASAVESLSYSAAVEPTHAMLKLKNDAWAYARPETSAATLEHLHRGKFVDVTGSTHYFVQVKLRSGGNGYVPISAVELTRAQDKIMHLSTDAAVLSQPNRYGKRLSEVHLGHDVHVVGVSLNYVKIRMKSGLEGYIPMTAAE